MPLLHGSAGAESRLPSGWAWVHARAHCQDLSGPYGHEFATSESLGGLVGKTRASHSGAHSRTEKTAPAGEEGGAREGRLLPRAPGAWVLRERTERAALEAGAASADTGLRGCGARGPALGCSARPRPGAPPCLCGRWARPKRNLGRQNERQWRRASRPDSLQRSAPAGSLLAAASSREGVGRAVRPAGRSRWERNSPRGPLEAARALGWRVGERGKAPHTPLAADCGWFPGAPSRVRGRGASGWGRALNRRRCGNWSRYEKPESPALGVGEGRLFSRGGDGYWAPRGPNPARAALGARPWPAWGASAQALPPRR